jgi:hypothetical protein
LGFTLFVIVTLLVIAGVTGLLVGFTLLVIAASTRVTNLRLWIGTRSADDTRKYLLGFTHFVIAGVTDLLVGFTLLVIAASTAVTDLRLRIGTSVDDTRKYVLGFTLFLIVTLLVIAGVTDLLVGFTLLVIVTLLVIAATGVTHLRLRVGDRVVKNTLSSAAVTSSFIRFPRPRIRSTSAFEMMVPDGVTTPLVWCMLLFVVMV